MRRGGDRHGRADRPGDRAGELDRRADQSAGAQHDHRGGARRPGRPRLCGGGAGGQAPRRPSPRQALTDISRETASVHQATAAVVAAISAISSVIGSIDDISLAITDAVGQQDVVSRGIAQNVDDAAARTPAGIVHHLRGQRFRGPDRRAGGPHSPCRHRVLSQQAEVLHTDAARNSSGRSRRPKFARPPPSARRCRGWRHICVARGAHKNDQLSPAGARGLQSSRPARETGEINK